MYKFIVMSEDHIELTDDQIKLVEAFEAAADYFAARILNEAEINQENGGETIEELVRSRGAEQANSKVAEEACREYEQVMQSDAEQSEILQLLKKGGKTEEGSYYVLDAAETTADRKLRTLSKNCKNSMMLSFLESQFAINQLPHQYLRAELKQRGSHIPYL